MCFFSFYTNVERQRYAKNITKRRISYYSTKICVVLCYGVVREGSFVKNYVQVEKLIGIMTAVCGLQISPLSLGQVQMQVARVYRILLEK